jgi:hypothetical protein
MNITDFIRQKGELTFEQYKFTEADAASLALLSYFTFETSGKTLKEAEGAALHSFAKPYRLKLLTDELLQPQESIEFGALIFNSNRYKDVVLKRYLIEDSPEDKIQYASMVFELEKNVYAICYRGTDLTLYGWEESFLIAAGEIPSQRRSLDYLVKTVSELPEEAKIYLIGHSKGGNFASYAFINAPLEVQKRIHKLYDLDGPGFHDDPYSQEKFLRIKKKVRKFLPFDSMVGTLLCDYKGYQVVSSVGKNGLEEHSLFNWQLSSDGRFIRLPSLSKTSMAFDKAFDQWGKEMPTEKRSQYIISLFEFLEACGVKQLTDLTEGLGRNRKRIIEEYRKSGKKERKLFIASSARLMQLYLKYLFSPAN